GQPSIRVSATGEKIGIDFTTEMYEYALENGTHIVSVETVDNAGNWAVYGWTFDVDLTVESEYTVRLITPEGPLPLTWTAIALYGGSNVTNSSSFAWPDIPYWSAISGNEITFLDGIDVGLYYIEVDAALNDMSSVAIGGLSIDAAMPGDGLHKHG